MLKRSLIIFFGLLYSVSSFSQQNITNDSIKSALNTIEQKVIIAISKADIEAHSNGVFELATLYFENGYIGLAYEKFQLHIDLTKKLKDKVKLIRAYRKIAMIYKNRLVFDVALEFYLSALDLSTDDTAIITGHIYSDIGGLYYDQGDFEKAQYFYEKGLKVYALNNAYQDMVASYNNLGEMYRFKNEYKVALDYYHSAIEINKEVGNEFYLAIIYNNIGEVYLGQGEFDLAFTNFSLGKKLHKKGNDIEYLAASYVNLGDYYYAIDQVDMAIENYLSCLEFDLEPFPKKHITLIHTYIGLIKSFNAKGNVIKELEYQKKYAEIKDIVLEKDKSKALFEIQIKYETNQKEEEILELQTKAKEEEKKKKEQRTNLIIVISLLILILLLVVYSYILKNKALKQKTLLFNQNDKLSKLKIENKEIDNRRLVVENKELKTREEVNKLNREKLELELNHKQRELSTSALHVIGKNEILSSLKKSINKLMDSGVSDPNQVLREMIREIDYNINLDEDWDTFKLHFEKVHQGFFLRLKENYSDLTVDELKLCAYLRINLSSKEIAQILNITQVAINKRRNRLRKKINLVASDDLFDFMSNV